MSELSREARALIQATRLDDDPRPEDEHRVLRAVALRAGVGAIAGSAVAVASKHAAGAPAAKAVGLLSSMSAPGVKLVGAIVVVSGMAAGGYVASGTMGQEHANPPASVTAPVTFAHPSSSGLTGTSPEEDTPGQESPRVSVDALKPAAAKEKEPQLTSPSSQELSSTRRSKMTTPTTATSTRDTKARTPSRLHEEIAAVSAANRALQDGDPERALKILDDEGSVLRNGVLQEESAVARILALCHAGKTVQAKQEAARFLHDHPRSPLASRLRRSCAFVVSNGVD